MGIVQDDASESWWTSATPRSECTTITADENAKPSAAETQRQGAKSTASSSEFGATDSYTASTSKLEPVKAESAGSMTPMISPPRSSRSPSKPPSVVSSKLSVSQASYGGTSAPPPVTEVSPACETKGKAPSVLRLSIDGSGVTKSWGLETDPPSGSPTGRPEFKLNNFSSAVFGDLDVGSSSSWTTSVAGDVDEAKEEATPAPSTRGVRSPRSRTPSVKSVTFSERDGGTRAAQRGAKSEKEKGLRTNRGAKSSASQSSASSVFNFSDAGGFVGMSKGVGSAGFGSDAQSVRSSASAGKGSNKHGSVTTGRTSGRDASIKGRPLSGNRSSKSGKAAESKESARTIHRDEIRLSTDESKVV